MIYDTLPFAITLAATVYLGLVYLLLSFAQRSSRLPRPPH